MPSSSLQFPKSERLCSRRLIDRLYAEGHRFRQYPFLATWMPVDGPTTPDGSDGTPRCQLMVVVPKRHVKHAVDRNRIKRLVRECYRLNKAQLTDSMRTQDLHIVLSLVYTCNEALPFDTMQKKLLKLLARLQQEAKAIR